MMYLFFLFNAISYDRLPARITDALFTSQTFLRWDFFDIGQGLITNFLVFPPIILVAVLFRKSVPAKKRSNRIDNGLKEAADEGIFAPKREARQRDVTHEEEKRNKSWPSVGYVVAWVLCFVYIVAGAL